jgi:hypothetical protein
LPQDILKVDDKQLINKDNPCIYHLSDYHGDAIEQSAKTARKVSSLEPSIG